MKKTFKSIVSFVMVVMMLSTAVLLVACNDDKQTFNNATDPLVLSTQAVDGNFNPFFYTSGTDGSVVGMTQLSMLSNDEEGKPVYGDDEAVIVKDMETVTSGSGDNQTTTYKFVLKNNVQFSNGSYLTIKDVLFNFYVYLDPVYTGSSTIYSTDIVGLQEYRTQEASEANQDSFMDQFQTKADTRVDTLISACEQINKDYNSAGLLTLEQFKQYLIDEYQPIYETIVADFDKACELFREELNTDYLNSLDAYQDHKFYDKDGNVVEGVGFTTDVEEFLYNEGYITWNKKDKTLFCSLDDLDKVKTWTKEQAIETIYQDIMPRKSHEVVAYWATSTELFNYIVNVELSNYFASTPTPFPNIEGIKFANKDQAVEVNGVSYDVPQYANAKRDQVTSGYEVLTITINKVDPKAIWNFALAIAPMYHYSDAEHIEAFDYETNFGVERSNMDWFKSVVGGQEVPAGAGPYVASKASGGTSNITKGDFHDKGVIYYEANPYYLAGEPLIKKVRFQVVAEAQMLNALDNGEIDFAQPNAKQETIEKLNSKLEQGIQNKSVTTLGYGYIGINASKIPNVNVRRAIMHAINTQECVNYYKTTATAIHRPMSTESWAYPQGCTSYYPYLGSPIPEDLNVVGNDYANYVRDLGKKAGQTLTSEEQIAFIQQLVEDAGYKQNSNGVYQKGTDILKYTFTIAGQETDHPAFSAMTTAAALLNKAGFEVEVRTDAQALNKLSTGALTVWAAAWGSTIDPDMYQVYHMDSKATSVNNWGYNAILRDQVKYAYEYNLIVALSEKIDLARETLDQKTRTILYKQALDLVMELAVELPTYQRDDLFAYNINKIDENTLYATPTSFKGLTSDMHLISLNVER